MILHTLNASPTSAAFQDCIALLAPSDAIILLGDGVYAAVDGTHTLAQLLERTEQVHVLQADAAAAGVLNSLGAVHIITVNGFVELSEKFSRQLAWY